MATPIQQSDAPDLPGYKPFTAAEARQYFKWCLLIIGVLLVWFAVPISINLVEQQTSPNLSHWDPAQAREAALTIRFLGAMYFAAGLVEHVVTEIAKLKP